MKDTVYSYIDPDNIKEIKGEKSVKVNGTQRTPEIILDTPNGIITFKGHSLPENTGDFYYPIINWVKDYVDTAPEKTNVTFDLEYFNSSSFKMLLEMIQLLSKLKIKEKELTVTWNYQEGDEDMFDSGKQLEELLDIKFDYICYR